MVDVLSPIVFVQTVWQSWMFFFPVALQHDANATQQAGKAGMC